MAKFQLYLCWLTDLLVFAIQFGLLNCFSAHLSKDLHSNLTTVHINTAAKVDLSSPELSCLYFIMHFATMNILLSQIISLVGVSHYPKLLDHVKVKPKLGYDIQKKLPIYPYNPEFNPNFKWFGKMHVVLKEKIDFL